MSRFIELRRGTVRLEFRALNPQLAGGTSSVRLLDSTVFRHCPSLRPLPLTYSMQSAMPRLVMYLPGRPLQAMLPLADMFSAGPFAEPMLFRIASAHEQD